MADHSERTRLERTIIEKSWKVKVSQSDVSWLESTQFQEFLDAWRHLARYYGEQPDDTQMSVEVLGEYVKFTSLLRRFILYLDLQPKYRDLAENAIDALEGWLQDIIRDVVTYLDSCEEDTNSTHWINLGIF